MKKITFLLCIFSLLSTNSYAKEIEKKILITNAKIFNGSDKLVEGKDVLVQGNKIVKIASGIMVTQDANTTIIDAGGRTLTPGFIDMHAHTMLQMSFGVASNSDEYYWAYVSTQTAKLYLSMGFTTVRDVGGNSFSLKKAIDQGIVEGPRVFPSGPMLSQTSGHSDHRTDSYASKLVANEPSVFMKFNQVQVADGETEVLVAVRENLRRGASQIKICVGGGTGSYADPLDVTQYTSKEIKAAVNAAEDWGTYVMAHVYNSAGVQRAVENGVKCIEHGNLMDEAALQLMKDNDVWLSPQVIVFTYHPNGYTDDQKKKHDQAFDGIDNMFKAAKKIGFKKIVFGSDIVTSLDELAHINNEFEFRTKWFTPTEILNQATAISGELLQLSGNRNPYPGEIGVIKDGALADILLMNGNPIKDITILKDYKKNLVLIMKDGKIYKNTL
ncbi:MAG: amidohydrolase family protein [Epsilonproteobacteria bacterium]|nr:MAG: amidohydrolase family protein [Campylobacterota bacterium]